MHSKISTRRAAAWASLAARSFLLIGIGALGARLPAQNPADLTPRDKTEVFIQHLVKVAKVDPAKYTALVLQYELGNALGELAHARCAESHGVAEGGAGHEGHDHSLAESPAPFANRDFVRDALREIHAEYAAALQLAEAAFTSGAAPEALETARGAASALTAKSDPYVAAHAEALLCEIDLRAAAVPQGADLKAGAVPRGDKALLEKVIVRAQRIVEKHRLYLIEDHRAAEMIALAFEGLGKETLEYLQYALLLTDYNDLPPDVAERARARLAALDPESGRPLGRVAGWMDKVEKLLGDEVTRADPTQAQGTEIVSALDKLIELQEARERKACPNCGSGDCNGACKSGRPKGARSRNPAQVSALADRKGQTLLHGVSRADASSIWGQLRDVDGARALQGFRGKLPARYERLLEQYYKNLSRTE
ncbi:MAG TPA: hypothetical protein VMT52_04960 [Planctomycetota bacterium]|nr:hypothetical protein [Planctomycetota bacterium]